MAILYADSSTFNQLYHMAKNMKTCIQTIWGKKGGR